MPLGIGEVTLLQRDLPQPEVCGWITWLHGENAVQRSTRFVEPTEHEQHVAQRAPRRHRIRMMSKRITQRSFGGIELAELQMAKRKIVPEKRIAGLVAYRSREMRKRVGKTLLRGERHAQQFVHQRNARKRFRERPCPFLHFRVAPEFIEREQLVDSALQSRILHRCPEP